MNTHIHLSEIHMIMKTQCSIINNIIIVSHTFTQWVYDNISHMVHITLGSYHTWFISHLVHYKHITLGSLYVEFNKVNGNIFIGVGLVPTETELQVISGWLRKFLAEPRKVWRITACTLKSITILSIPQCVNRVENRRLPRRSTKC